MIKDHTVTIEFTTNLRTDSNWRNTNNGRERSNFTQTFQKNARLENCKVGSVGPDLFTVTVKQNRRNDDFDEYTFYKSNYRTIRILQGGNTYTYVNNAWQVRGRELWRW